MDVVPFKPDYADDLAAMFVLNYLALRAAVPALPDRMGDPQHVAEMLASTFDSSSSVVAIQSGQSVGCLSWFLVDGFRGTERKAAYCPEWGHAAVSESRRQIYNALYRAAATQWAAASCHVHAITLLAHDKAAETTWFWNGFGLTVVDAIRAMEPLESITPTPLTIRKATLDDVETLSQLEREHWQHYTQAPVLMDAYSPQKPAELADFLCIPESSIWLVLDGKDYAGYMRFDADSSECATVVRSDNGVAITGAFIRPAYRRLGAASAMLNAALQDYSAQNAERCGVDFESFNPEAAAFWLRYFQPVCYSLLRVPERISTSN